MCRCCARPSETERHLHTELPRRLAYSSLVGDGNSRAQIRNTPAFGVFRVQNQPAKELVHPYTADCVLRHKLNSIQRRLWLTPEHTLTVKLAASSFKAGTCIPLKRFQNMLGLMAAASPLIPLGMLYMRPLQFWFKARVPPRAWTLGRFTIKVTNSCVKALSIWTSSHL